MHFLRVSRYTLQFFVNIGVLAISDGQFIVIPLPQCASRRHVRLHFFRPYADDQHRERNAGPSRGAARDIRGDEMRVMVAVANPPNAISLVRSTYRLCQSIERPHATLIHMLPAYRL
ncbi:MAG: hypothetical protein KGY81_02005 [Phycisphaerae bacterium]|jgi:hypothetical protein|nr:hypothetical protein [Phycisphaerae bacterium]